MGVFPDVGIAATGGIFISVRMSDREESDHARNANVGYPAPLSYHLSGCGRRRHALGQFR